MEKDFSIKTKLTRFVQPGLSECGPASLCAAMSMFRDPSDLSVDKIVEAAGIQETIASGSSVKQLALAVEKISNGELCLLYKMNSSVDEIKTFLSDGVPVVADWQGSTFPAEDGGKGHYSLIKNFIGENVIMVDSLPDFQDERVVPIKDFESEWSDFDVIQIEGKEKRIDTTKMIYIAIPSQKATEYIDKYRFQSGDKYPGSI